VNFIYDCCFSVFQITKNWGNQAVRPAEEKDFHQNYPVSNTNVRMLNKSGGPQVKLIMFKLLYNNMMRGIA